MSWSQTIQHKLPKTDANYLKYLEDSRMESRKNAVKFLFDDILHTEVALALERKLSPFFSIEAGAGVIPYYTGLSSNYWFDLLDTSDKAWSPKGMGFSYYIMPKYYGQHGAIDEGTYFGLLLKQRFYNNELGNKIIHSQYLIMFGMQKLLNKRLCLDYGYGFGVSRYKIEKGKIDLKGNTAPLIEHFISGHIRFGIGIYFGKSPVKDVAGKSKKSKKGEDSDE